MKSRAQQVIEDCRSIAQLSEDPTNTTRTFLSAPMHDVHRFLGEQMLQIGMEVWLDAMGNLRGLYRDEVGRGARLLLGSHVDTVPAAGAYDGVLGVVLAIQLLRCLDRRSPGFDIEVVAFSEEEGVRFGLPFLGSRALTGEVDEELMQRRDANGISVETAIRSFGLDPLQMAGAAMHPDTFGYVEFHIEQGPVLDSLSPASRTQASGVRNLGVVEAIAGQTRLDLRFVGEANHAGTTPMEMRRDALAGAAEWVLAVERVARSVADMVATVGEIEVRPDTANVIPGEAIVSLDLRHASDQQRGEALDQLVARARRIGQQRGLQVEARTRSERDAVAMNPVLTDQLERAVRATGSISRRLTSGAGHDAMVMAAKVPAAMLFLPSPGGISHHPDETVRVEDVQAALDAGLYFLDHLQRP